MLANGQQQPALRYGIVALAMLGLLAGAVVLFQFNPTQHAFYPICVFHKLTGLQCPGCGASRALYSLLHGHLLAALHFNPLLVLALPFLAISAGRRLLRELAGKPPPPVAVRAFWIKLLVVAIIAFTILRNIPFAPFTYLSPP
ncbi:MAG: hypothetical protein JWR69_3912 [Pedosphaera sp.]|nr:hypothetical protein [Pedosphaera sp.]